MKDGTQLVVHVMIMYFDAGRLCTEFNVLMKYKSFFSHVKWKKRKIDKYNCVCHGDQNILKVNRVGHELLS